MNTHALNTSPRQLLEIVISSFHAAANIHPTDLALVSATNDNALLQQGGPGRGAYWVVDDKERKNLLDSIYRAHQTMPLGDRNGQRTEPPYSLVVSPPKNGPMLLIDGRFTDASTYLQSKRSDDEIANENQIVPNDSSVSSEITPTQPADNSDAEYASMMYNLTVGGGSPKAGDNSAKLSARWGIFVEMMFGCL